MNDIDDSLPISLFSEIFMIDQLARNKLAKVLPKGMELSHFSVLNHLAGVSAPRTPAQLAQTFSLTRGAMTNTLHKLEWAGHIHVTPDWEDARRKHITISPAGRDANAAAIKLMAPALSSVLGQLDHEKLRDVLPILRDLRKHLGA